MSNFKIIQAVFFGGIMLGLAGCTTTQEGTSFRAGANYGVNSAAYNLVHSKPLEERHIAQNEPFTINYNEEARVPEQFRRRVVTYPTKEAPGTIIVEPQNHYLYLIAGRGRAIRYGVGVGSAGLGFSGETNLQFKRKWPRWIPTDDMIARNPARYKQHADGMAGGPRNPLGARALYLFQNNIDTYYRIHGTNQPSSIGKSVSAGCIRLLNMDVVDLFERVRPGAKVIVR